MTILGVITALIMLGTGIATMVLGDVVSPFAYGTLAIAYAILMLSYVHELRRNK